MEGGKGNKASFGDVGVTRGAQMLRGGDGADERWRQERWENWSLAGGSGGNDGVKNPCLCFVAVDGRRRLRDGSIFEYLPVENKMRSRGCASTCRGMTYCTVPAPSVLFVPDISSKQTQPKDDSLSTCLNPGMADENVSAQIPLPLAEPGSAAAASTGKVGLEIIPPGNSHRGRGRGRGGRGDKAGTKRKKADQGRAAYK